MTGKHTPGPWAILGRPVGDGFERRIYIHHESPGCSGGAFCRVDTLHSTEVAHATQDANARLIAAAPDLLEALETVEAAFTGDGLRVGYHRRFYDAVRAAIAKARGGE